MTLTARNALRRREQLDKADREGHLRVYRFGRYAGLARKGKVYGHNGLEPRWFAYDAEGLFVGTRPTADRAERLIVERVKEGES